jgi:hypothetical protein
VLIRNSFDIISRATSRIAELGVDSTRFEGTPKQNRIVNQLNECTRLFDIIMKHILLNDAGTVITGTIGQVDDEVNALLLRLKKAAQLTTFPQVPTPVHVFITDFNGGGGSLPSPADEGDLLWFHNGVWTNLPRGADGTSLTSTPTSIVWSSQVGNGIPSGGSASQYLRKNSNTSYDVVWDTLSVSKITDLTASSSELNLLDGATWSTEESNTLVGIDTGMSIQDQLNSKMPTALADGSFLVGNAGGVATPVSPTGDVTFNNAGVFTIGNGVVIDAYISPTASINRQKLAQGSVNSIVVNDSSGLMIDTSITPLVVIVSDANGLPTASAVTSSELDQLSGVSSNVQGQFSDKLSFSSAITPAQGDLIYYNGSDWVNIGVGTISQVLVSNGTIPTWGSATANGIPSGGTTNQYLRKIDNTSYNAEWHTLVMTDVTDVTATSIELNLLSGLSVNAAKLNLTANVTSDIQGQLNSKLNVSLANQSLFVGSGSNLATQLGPGNPGDVLTIVGGAVQWLPPTPPGNVSGVAPSTDNAVVRWNGIGADSIQSSSVIISDTNDITGVTSLSSGQVDILNQAAIRLHETGSTNYVGLRAAGIMSADYTITLPAASPSINTFLKYDGTDYVWAASGGGVTSSTVSTAGGTITFDFLGSTDKIFVGSASFSTPKTIALSNDTSAVRMDFVLEITDVLAVLEFPSSFTMNDGRWDTITKKWTALNTGVYTGYAIFDGTDWRLSISQDKFS